jgi:hypothetical protein
MRNSAGGEIQLKWKKTGMGTLAVVLVLYNFLKTKICTFVQFHTVSYLYSAQCSAK